MHWVDEVHSLNEVLELIYQLFRDVHLGILAHLVVESFILLLLQLQVVRVDGSLLYPAPVCDLNLGLADHEASTDEPANHDHETALTCHVDRGDPCQKLQVPESQHY